MRIPIALLVVSMIISAAPISYLYYFGSRILINDVRRYASEYTEVVESNSIEKVKFKCLSAKINLEKIIDRHENSLLYSLEIIEAISKNNISPNDTSEVFWASPFLPLNINKTSIEEILNGTSNNSLYRDLYNSLSPNGKQTLLKLIEIFNQTYINISVSNPKTNDTIYYLLENISREANIKLHHFLMSIIKPDFYRLVRESLFKYSYISKIRNITIFLRTQNITISPYIINPIHNSIAEKWTKAYGFLWNSTAESSYVSRSDEIFAVKKVINISEFEYVVRNYNFQYYFIIQDKNIILCNDPFYLNKVVPRNFEKYLKAKNYSEIILFENKRYCLSSDTISNGWKIIAMDIDSSSEIEKINSGIRMSYEIYRRKFLFTLAGSIVTAEVIILILYYTEDLRSRIFSKLRIFHNRKIGK